MSLRKFPRKRVPINGTWVQVSIPLSWIMNRIEPSAFGWSETNWTNRDSVTGIMVPVHARLEPQGVESPIDYRSQSYPKGVIFRPVAYIGTMDSPMTDKLTCYDLFSQNGALDGWQNGNDWHYEPFGYSDFDEAPGGETSVYDCARCGKTLQHDPAGDRMHESAMLIDDEMQCKACDSTGLILYREARDQIERCRRLAGYLGEDHVKQFCNRIEWLTGFGNSDIGHRQCRLYLEDKFSFGWGERYKREGIWTDGIHGGLIMHGPHVEETSPGEFKFTTWDSKLSAQREATDSEVKSIHWSIHT